LVVGGVLGFAAIVYGLVGNPFDPFDNRRFTPAEWREADNYSRARMARSLIRRHLRSGTPEGEVVALLGEPEIVGSPGDLYRPKTPGIKVLVWGLGSWSPIYDDAFLYVHIDATGRVSRAEVDGF
jgi:hypothetical protein